MSYPISNLGTENILRDVHDPVAQAIRTTATATLIVPPSFDVDMSHTEDSVRLGDGTNYITSTVSGGKVSLDVNVTNKLTITQGSNDLVVNSDGSIQTRDSIGLFTLPFDAITVMYPTPTQEVYQSRIGGITGTVIQTVTVNYTDATKKNILNVWRV